MDDGTRVLRLGITGQERLLASEQGERGASAVRFVQSQRPLAIRQLVQDVEGVTQRPVEFRSCSAVELIDGSVVESAERHVHEVVTVDNRGFGQSVFGVQFYFGVDPPDRPGDRGTGHCGENGYRSVSSDNVDRPPPCRLTQVGPVDIASSYHSGEVWAAIRAADSTSAGSGGSSSYAATSR